MTIYFRDATFYLPFQMDYRDICIESPDPNCAAKILALFQFKAKVKSSTVIEQTRENEYREEQYKVVIDPDDKDGWVYMSGQDIYCFLLGEYGINTIYNCLNWITQAGFLNVRRNPKQPYDRTKQYQFADNSINEAIRQLPPLDRFALPIPTQVLVKAKKTNTLLNDASHPKEASISLESEDDSPQAFKQYTKKEDKEEDKEEPHSEKFFANGISTTNGVTQPTVPAVLPRPKQAYKAVMPGQPNGSAPSVPPVDKDQVTPAKSRRAATKSNVAPEPDTAKFDDWLFAILEEFGHRHFYRSAADRKNPALGQYVKAASELLAAAQMYNETSDVKVTPDILKTYWGGLERKGWLFTKKELPVNITTASVMPKYFLEYLGSPQSPLRKAAKAKLVQSVQVIDAFNLDDI